MRVTLEGSSPDSPTDWTTRSPAKGLRTVARTWQGDGVMLWRIDTCNVSSNLAFSEKLGNAIGLYLSAADYVVGFSFDEKTQFQVLYRTELSLSISPRRVGALTRN